MLCVFSALITGSLFLLQDEGPKESVPREGASEEESQDECEDEYAGYNILQREYGSQKRYFNYVYDFSVSIPNHWAVDPGDGWTYCTTERYGGVTEDVVAWSVGFYNPTYTEKDEGEFGYMPTISISVKTGISKTAYEIARERNEGWIKAESINEIQIGGMEAFSIESNMGHETFLKTEDGKLFGFYLYRSYTDEGKAEILDNVYRGVLSSFSLSPF